MKRNGPDAEPARRRRRVHVDPAAPCNAPAGGGDGSRNGDDGAEDDVPEDDAVWRALGSTHRRRLLDLLRSGPRTTGDLAAAFPDLSRFAVMQHLDVLAEADLVLVRREGRERWNHLNPVPIRRIHDRWLSRFDGLWAAELLALRIRAESPRTGTSSRRVRRARRGAPAPRP